MSLVRRTITLWFGLMLAAVVLSHDAAARPVREVQVTVSKPVIAPPPGRYEIACSEFCGSGDGQIKAALISVAATPTTC
jgi:heme/copper-type cytochrome/quinol oxidase subunit 2